jgi:hypothetical protein
MLVLGTIGFNDDCLLIRINSLRGSYPQGSQWELAWKNNLCDLNVKKKYFCFILTILGTGRKTKTGAHIVEFVLTQLSIIFKPAMS